MKKAYNELRKIVVKVDDPSNIPLNMTMHLSKLSEEIGEMAQSINKLNGRKKIKNESRAEIFDNIEEEVADSIQCLMAIAINAGVDYEALKKRLVEKNKKFVSSIEEK